MDAGNIYSADQHYKGVLFNFIRVTRGWRIQFAEKNCYITLEQPLTWRTPDAVYAITVYVVLRCIVRSNCIFSTCLYAHIKIILSMNLI